MVSLILHGLQMFSLLKLAVGSGIGMSDCTLHCGYIQIPYPFGIGTNCYHDPSYEIICNASFSPSRPMLRQFNLEVLEINWPGRYSRRDAYSDEGDSIGQMLKVGFRPPKFCDSTRIRSPDFKGTPYSFAMSSNVLIMEGCGCNAVLYNRTGAASTGCASICDSDAAYMCTACYSAGCCQSSLESWKEDLDFYEIAVHFEQPMNSTSCNASAGLIDAGTLANYGPSWSSLEIFPTILHWKATFVSHLPFYSAVNVSCHGQDRVTCTCRFPYEGNPYLPYGCQVVEECIKCESSCDLVNRGAGLGSYYTCQKHLPKRRLLFLGFIIGIGVVLLLVGSYWLKKYVKRRKQIMQKVKNFKRNGGLLLQQQMSSDEGVAKTTKSFTVSELEKATDNFNENRILGQGGQGTVYKGMLMNGKIVAIKKARKVDESQIEQFVNEVVVLSQIDHRHVVKLLGCCLETEVPMLVYEFISNGTVYEHIHGQSEDFYVSWKLRLQIAAESAGAIAYLHSSSSAPVYHRDIKSTNILLDEKFRAKVSDFGTSKAITIDQTHVTTAVLGTYGYLDPEYFLTNQFTEKSDVYSFGVVLVELITAKKPICLTGNGGWINLAADFITQMENSRLFDIIDARITDEGKIDELVAVAELARKCLNMNGKLRPTMKEIAVQLDAIRSSNRPIPKKLVPAQQ
ncbi:hypothetical protein RND81_02G063600 [Saponaria officinalis]|uniref:Protein kinase domain-containing protein n=1 Tax=Saponaria officinalis TaxID=3572 RepID=A0AAW1ML09_SAPOF